MLRSTLALCCLFSCVTPRAVQLAAPGEPTLTVATYNVNFGIAGDAPTLAAIEATNADVVLLQETTPAWEASLRPRFAARYATIAFHHCCGAGGLAVLSRYPVLSRETLQPPEGGWFPAWRVVVDGPFGKVQVLSVHLRPPASDTGDFIAGAFTTPPLREHQMQTFVAALDPSLPTLVVGDFNEAKAGVTRLLSKRGVRDGLPEFQGSATTWRWPVGPFTLREQLDHIAYDAALEPLRIEVLPLGSSDHWPVVAEFRRAPVPLTARRVHDGLSRSP